MTTAARPTFDPARGGRGKGENDLSALSKQYSSRDMPSHTKLKYRESGQNTSDDLRGRDLRQELEDKERNVREKVVKEKRSFTETPGVTSSGVSSSNDPKGIVGVGRSGGGGGGHSSISSKRPRTDPSSIDDDDIVDDDEDDDDSDEDDTAELLRELQKIKKERAEEQAKREREKNEEEERIRKENLLKGNPLLNPTDKGSFKIKKRWDDDIVFKNCAKSEPKNKEQHFINDTIRSEFHRKFMEKYVK